MKNNSKDIIVNIFFSLLNFKKYIEIAKNLLSMNMSLEDISKATGLLIEEINKLTK